MKECFLKLEVFKQCLYKFVLVRFKVLVCNNYLDLCCKKYDGDCISGLAFVRGTLDDPKFGGFIGTLPDRPLDCSI
jgi:hypothetical protein